MPIGSKIKDLLKKITVQNPKTKQDVQLGSALASKDPNLKKIGQKIIVSKLVKPWMRVFLTPRNRSNDPFT